MQVLTAEAFFEPPDYLGGFPYTIKAPVKRFIWNRDIIFLTRFYTVQLYDGATLWKAT